jgi:hypothetical protein
MIDLKIRPSFEVMFDPFDSVPDLNVFVTVCQL